MARDSPFARQAEAKRLKLTHSVASVDELTAYLALDPVDEDQGDHQTNKQDFGECLSAYLSLGILFVCLRNGNDLFVCLYRLPRHYSVLAFE